MGFASLFRFVQRLYRNDMPIAASAGATDTTGRAAGRH